MGDAAPGARQHALDAAALHPDLQGRTGTRYYQLCAQARLRLKALLAERFALEHDLFLLSNTTHGLVAVVAGLALDGFHLDIGANTYPPYITLSPWSARAVGPGLPLLTHVDPITGHVMEIPVSAAAPTVVDAAQSFATIRHHQEALRADVFFCPLHKNAGITAGLGLLGLKPGFAAPGLRAVAAIAEAGTASLDLLVEAVERTVGLSGRVFNRLSLDLGRGIREELAERGIIATTPAGAGLPFVCLRGLSPVLAAAACRSLGLTVKFFPRHGVTRISGAVRGSGDSDPLDRSRDLENALRGLLREEHK